MNTVFGPAAWSPDWMPVQPW